MSVANRSTAFWAVLLFSLMTGNVAAQSLTPLADSDKDGLSDEFEQQLLENFRPTFMVGTKDCAVAPARFAAGSKLPVLEATDGTIYGQAFPTNPIGASPKIELHYFHLWSRDCGRMGHPLDAEHVAALLNAYGESTLPNSWQAVYWYAAAHEDTSCDASRGAKAASLDAVENGVKVWVSNGKHGSFLRAEDCRAGCGGDRCENMAELQKGALINVGEISAPMSGALWTGSDVWPLAEKMRTDFGEDFFVHIASAKNGEVTIPVGTSPAPVRSTIRAGNAALNGVGTGVGSGNRHTSSALATATRKTLKSLGRSFRITRKALADAIPSLSD